MNKLKAGVELFKRKITRQNRNSIGELNSTERCKLKSVTLGCVKVCVRMRVYIKSLAVKAKNDKHWKNKYSTKVSRKRCINKRRRDCIWQRRTIRRNLMCCFCCCCLSHFVLPFSIRWLLRTAFAIQMRWPICFEAGASWLFDERNLTFRFYNASIYQIIHVRSALKRRSTNHSRNRLVWRRLQTKLNVKSKIWKCEHWAYIGFIGISSDSKS